MSFDFQHITNDDTLCSAYLGISNIRDKVETILHDMYINLDYDETKHLLNLSYDYDENVYYHIGIIKHTFKLLYKNNITYDICPFCIKYPEDMDSRILKARFIYIDDKDILQDPNTTLYNVTEKPKSYAVKINVNSFLDFHLYLYNTLSNIKGFHVQTKYNMLVKMFPTFYEFSKKNIQLCPWTKNDILIFLTTVLCHPEIFQYLNCDYSNFLLYSITRRYNYNALSYGYDNTACYSVYDICKKCYQELYMVKLKDNKDIGSKFIADGTIVVWDKYNLWPS